MDADTRAALRAAVDDICRRAGGIWDDPSIEDVESILAAKGLRIIRARRSGARKAQHDARST